MIDPKLIPFFEEMRDELDSQRLTVVLAPALEPMHCCHMIRRAAGSNPDWYSDLCYENMRPGKGNRRDYTTVKRKDLFRLLDLIIVGTLPNSRFYPYLEYVAKLKQTEVTYE